MALGASSCLLALLSPSSRRNPVFRALHTYAHSVHQREQEEEEEGEEGHSCARSRSRSHSDHRCHHHRWQSEEDEDKDGDGDEDREAKKKQKNLQDKYAAALLQTRGGARRSPSCCHAPPVAAAATLLEGKRVHAEIASVGFDRKRFLSNLLVRMYGEFKRPREAQSVFDRIQDPNVFSWTLLISAYAQNGLLRSARAAFDRMPSRDEASWNLMISLCARFGQLDEARSLFDEMPQKGVITWSAMIAGYAQNGHCREALELSQHMLEDGLQAEKITLVSVLNACATLAVLEDGDSCKQRYPPFFDSYGGQVSNVKTDELYCGFSALQQGKLINAFVSNLGLHSDVVLGNSLINMYSKCGSLHDARRVFDRLPCPDVISWNTLISAYSHSGYLDNAWDLFERMPIRDEVSWTSMITAYAQNGHSKLALDLYHRMDSDGVKPIAITFLGCLDACSAMKWLHKGKLVHAGVSDNGFQSDDVIGNALIDMYGKCGRVNEARKVFNGLCRQSLVSWNTMISAYARNGLSKEAFDLLFQMGYQEGLTPNRITFLALLDACAELATLSSGKPIHAIAANLGYDLDIVVSNALIHWYGKCGVEGLSDVKNVFRRMRWRNTSSWNAIIAIFARSKNAKAALEFFRRMESEGLTPDKITFISALDACANLSALEQAKIIHAKVLAREIMLDQGPENTSKQGYLHASVSNVQDVVLGTALLNIYGKCGSLKDARSLFDNLPYRDLVAWNAIIAAYAWNGEARGALELFEEMEMKGMKPDGITFLSILDACKHSGLFDEACRVFASMIRDHSVKPTVEHYGCMIDLLGREGRLGEAEHLIKSMPIEPDTIAWMNLFGACKVDVGMDREECIDGHLLELDLSTTSCISTGG